MWWLFISGVAETESAPPIEFQAAPPLLVAQVLMSDIPQTFIHKGFEIDVSHHPPAAVIRSVGARLDPSCESEHDVVGHGRVLGPPHR